MPYCGKCGHCESESRRYCGKCGAAMSSTILQAAKKNEKEKKSEHTSFVSNVELERILKPAIICLLGWIGVPDLVWGRKWIGCIKFIFAAIAMLLYNENFVLDIVTWSIFSVLWVLVIINLWKHFTGKVYNSKAQNNVVLPFLLIVVIMVISCAHLLVESIQDFCIGETKADYTVAQIEDMKDSRNIDGHKFCIHGKVKSIDGSTVILQSRGDLSFSIDFFESEKSRLKMLKKDSLISAYCVGRGIEDNAFTAEKCLLK